jgi:plastocyanin
VTRTTRLLAARALAVAALGLPLAACGGTASPAASVGTSGCGVGEQISVSGSKVTPQPSTVDVKAGCEVRLTVTADRSSEVHVHVVDLEKPITAGKPLTISFTPTQQGVYEVELHDPDLLLVKLAVR